MVFCLTVNVISTTSNYIWAHRIHENNPDGSKYYNLGAMLTGNPEVDTIIHTFVEIIVYYLW